MSALLFRSLKFIAALAILSFTFQANAADCPRGTLDKQF